MGDASTDLLVIATPLRKVQDEGASDIFNIVTADRRTRMDANVIKNMDNICFFADSLLVLEKSIYEFLKFCQRKNQKLKTSKFNISEHA